MGVTSHIVPVHDFDADAHAEAIREYGADDKDHRADLARIAEVKRGLARLTAAQRRSSRWPTRAELKQTMAQLGRDGGYAFSLAPHRGPWTEGSLIKTKPGRREVIASMLHVHTLRDGTYHCAGEPDILHRFARAISLVAGPQVTFLGHDYSPAVYTALFVAEAASAPSPEPKAKTKTKAKAKAKTKAKTKAKPKGSRTSL
ncbi:MAG: hypothetical protein IPL61_17970 [Myxococcales bacterium]|nr:hypothetical protein [Myxococcales bacterium]